MKLEHVLSIIETRVDASDAWQWVGIDRVQVPQVLHGFSLGDELTVNGNNDPQERLLCT
jgi:hypothetical protein